MRIFHLGHTMVFPIKVMFNSAPPFQVNFTTIWERGQLDKHLPITSGKEKIHILTFFFMIFLSFYISIFLINDFRTQWS